MEFYPSPNSSPTSHNPLLEKNIRLQSENFSLNEKIRELENVIYKKEQEVNEEKGKVFARDEKVKELTQAWSQCCDEVNSLTRRNSILRENMRSYKTTDMNIQHQQQTNEQLIEDVNKLRSTSNRIAEVEKLLEEKEEKIRNMLAINSPYILSRLTDVQAKLKETTTKYEEAVKKLEKVQNDLDEQILIAKILRKEVKLIETDLEAKNKELLHKNATLEGLKATMNRVTHENNQQKQQLRRSKEMMEKLQWEEQQARYELLECQRELESQCRLNYDLRSQLQSTTVQNFQEARGDKENVMYHPNEQDLGMQAMQKEMAYYHVSPERVN